GSVGFSREPIALYHERDLHVAGDGGWLARYDPPALWACGHVPIGRARRYGDGTDLTVVSFGNGLRMSLRAASRLAADGIGCRGLGLRGVPPPAGWAAGWGTGGGSPRCRPPTYCAGPGSPAGCW